MSPSFVSSVLPPTLQPEKLSVVSSSRAAPGAWSSSFQRRTSHSGAAKNKDGEPPQQMTGYFPPWENEIYLNLLNKYGQPLKENHRAVMAFQQEFNYRVWSSVTAHPNKFNGGQTTHKTGPRGGKIKSTVYKDWVAAHGGEWVGFQWRPL